MLIHRQDTLAGITDNDQIAVSFYMHDVGQGYVDLSVTITPRFRQDPASRATYSRLTAAEALDVVMAQTSLLWDV